MQLENVVSLFDGVSCGQLALRRAGILYRKYYASEIDKHAIKVTMHNWPATIQLGDVTRLTGQEVSNVDLLLGGSPCQGFSFAGKRLNFEDPRSKLFFDFVRIRDAVKPKYFLLENVRMKKESQDIISRYMGVEPIKINSALVSGQNRVRLYWTNIPGVMQPEDRGITFQDAVKECFPLRQKWGVGYVAQTNKHKSATLTGRKHPQRCAYALFRRVAVYGESNKHLWRHLTPEERETLQTMPTGYTSCVSKAHRVNQTGNGWTVAVVAHILHHMKLARKETCKDE
jgi:site-specific DNA-cytosine methylase